MRALNEGRTAGRIDAAPMRWTPAETRLVLAALLIAAAVVLGGASRENPLRLAATELVALPLAAVSISSMTSVRRVAVGAAGFPLAVLAMVIAVPLLQIAPLPPSLWTTFPGQSPRVEALRLAQLPAPWLPISLSPDETRRAALALIPPAATFIAMLGFNAKEARLLTWLWIALATVGLALGLAQVTTPMGGHAYPYRTTNLGSLVGLFANRNHQAAFLLALLPLAAALATTDRPRQGRTAQPPGLKVPPWATWPFILVSIVALGVIRSRAGVILAAPAALGAMAVTWRARRPRLGGWTLAAVGAAIGLAALAVAVFGSAPILQRFESQSPTEFRFEAWPYVIAAARDYLPFGSGLGSFDRVFEAVEPLAFVSPAYFNHAHNDYLELWLETGVAGLVVFWLFLVWLILAVRRAWRSGSPLAQAASVAIGLLMATSAVDYPLRTETLAVLFAFCCGLLAKPAAPAR